jgi:uroporphyrinogen-III synthase
MSERRQVWVTRAQPGAETTAARLLAAGLRPLVAPLLEAHALAAAQSEFERPQLDAIDALAFTSANGVRAFAALDPRRDLPAFCVGAATASAARAAGFAAAVSAEGDATALAALLATRLPPGARVLHPCATETAGDLATPLTAAGLGLRALPLYETRAVDALPPAVAAAFEAHALDALLIHSPKASRAAARLLAPLGHDALGEVEVCAISEAALAPLRALPFAALKAAATPDEIALLALLT